MAVLVITPPDPLVSLATAKAHLRVTTDDEDVLIQGYIATASALIDGPFGILGRAVGLQTLEVAAMRFGELDRLPLGPVTEITSVKYVDSLGDDQDVDDSIWRLAGDRFSLASGRQWPAYRADADGIRVRYVAGFADVPAPIQHAVLLLVGQWFRNRMAVNVGNLVNEMPNGVKALLAPYKIWKV